MARIPEVSRPQVPGTTIRGRLLTALVATALAAVVWGGWGLKLSRITNDFEKSWQDRLRNQLEPTPEREDFVFLGIDDPTGDLSALEPEEIERSVALQAMSEPYPWNRRVWAEIIRRLGEAEARLILLDIYFPGPSGDPDADAELAAALEEHGERVVLASQWTAVGASQFSHFEPYGKFLGDGEVGFGYVNFWPDPDDEVFRSAVYAATKNEMVGAERHEDEEEYLSFAAVAAGKLGVDSIPGERELRFAGRQAEDPQTGERIGDLFEAGRSYQPRSLYTLFGEREWEENYDEGRFFKDKVVIVGPANPIFQDQVSTPHGIIFGAQMHLQALACLLEDSFWKRPPPWLNWLALLVMAGVGAGLVALVRSPVQVLVLALVIAVVWIFGCGYAADASGVLFTGFSGLLGLAFVTIGGEGTEFLFEQRERRRLHRQLRRSVSPDVAEALAKAPGGYLDAARGGRRMVAVLFSDVRNFTARSESMEPEELVAQLNAYFGRMVGAVFATGGTIDKFIGDAVMASWGGLRDLSEGEMAAAAVAAAEGMQEALAGLNRDWEERGWAPFEVGVGIHLGEAVVGEIGSEERSDFTTIGDAVNVASRVEGLTKQLGVPLLVTKRVAEAAGGEMVSLGLFRVKGRAEPLEVFVPGTAGAECWVDGLGSFREGDAGPLEHLAHGDGPFAGPARFYLSWLASQGGQVPVDWDGVVTLETK